jgi:PilZ domain
LTEARPPDSPPDARAHDRSPVAVGVTLTARDGRDGGRTAEGTTRNVGMGGFSLVVAEPFPVGTRVAAELRLGEGDGATRIRSDGQVVWVRGTQLGVTFTGTDAENHRKLSARFLCNPMASAWD